MCGIFGMMVGPESTLSQSDIRKVFDGLFRASETRGKEASGTAYLDDTRFEILKNALTASELMKTKVYRDWWKEKTGRNNGFQLILGHTRLVTNGSQLEDNNNQPVFRDQIVCIHNGIIVNELELWNDRPHLKRHYQVDTEVLIAMMSDGINRNFSACESFRQVFQAVRGATTVAMLVEEEDVLFLATNNGSLYFLYDEKTNDLFFASERLILKKMIDKAFLTRKFNSANIVPVLPGEYYSVNVRNGKMRKLTNQQPTEFLESEISGNGRAKRKFKYWRQPEIKDVGKDKFVKARNVVNEEKLLDVPKSAMQRLKRCTRCILPDTFPFIKYDQSGICNYCLLNLAQNTFPNHGSFSEDIKPYLDSSKQYDCLVPISGGRDSTYALHYLKKECGLRPIAFTYDWGMVTEIARRNISRVCGDLGVEHILISADIERKRMNIRANILAWLKRPSLGMVPLFMAGDKHFFYHANQLKKELDVNLLIFSQNSFERTDFKVGFCGVDDRQNKRKFYNLNFTQQLKLVSYYLREFCLNPAYFNSSVLDTISGYFSYYLTQHRYLLFYDYFPWNEEAIHQTLIDHYGWETDPNTKSTWRIGDGTSAFYNYIYYRVAGFTENDTFRSNQIRQGVLSRDKALQTVDAENIPRYQSIKWYCDTLGLNFKNTIERINQIPVLYSSR